MHFSIGASLSSCLLLIATVQASSLHIRDASNTFPDPNDDPFYKAPSHLKTFQPGQVIRSRKVETSISPKKAKASYQVLYRTTDTQGHSEATVATLWEPITPKSPPQILSYHTFMDSDSVDCEPSYAWLKNSSLLTKLPVSIDAPFYVNWALEHGIYVVDPDDEGPKAAFIAGFQQGQAALDGMRAIRNFFELPKNTEIAMTG